MKRYRYSECFRSIQGEGHYIGAPSVFLRFWGCNFTCEGFSNPERSTLDFDPADVGRLEDMPVITQGCDTVYAWRRDFQHLSKQATAAELCDTIEGLCPSFRHRRSGQSIHLVLTGGEPMLSQTAIAELIDIFSQRNNLPRHITIETNGTQAPREPFANTLKRIRDNQCKWFWSVSPKLSLSGEDWQKAIKPGVVANYAQLSDIGQLKYVVDGSERCWSEIEEATAAYRSAGVSWNVWIMPVGASMEQQQEHQERICMEAVERGYNFSPRVQNWIFGNRTGT